MLISGHLLPPGSASGSGIVRVGGERRLRPWGTALMDSGGRGQFGPLPAYWGRGPSDPTAPHYDGAAEEAGSGSGEDRRVRPVQGPKALTGRVRHPETRPPTRTEVLGQKSPRGTPGVPASKKLRAGPRRPAPRIKSGRSLNLADLRLGSARGDRARPHLPSPLRGGRTRPKAEPGGGRNVGARLPKRRV
jgi:hypothetical protein